MSDKYILEGHKTIKCLDLISWGEWFESADTRVAKSEIRGITISTVFLGLDYSFGGDKPILFETMVFGGSLSQEMDRYATWEEAEAGHLEMIKRVKENSRLIYVLARFFRKIINFILRCKETAE